MSFIKRAWLSIIRKPVKSALLLMILFLVGTFLLSITTIERAAQKQNDEYLNSGNLGFILRNNPEHMSLDPRGMGIIPDSLIQEMKNTNGITEVNRKISRVITLRDLENIDLERAKDFDRETEDMYGQVMHIYGEDDSSKDLAFALESIQLKEGRHITADDKEKALVHEEFAQKNSLQLGDTIHIRAVNHPDENPYESKVELSFSVVGIFSGSNAQMPSSNIELNQNVLFTDISTVQSVLAIPEKELLFQDATFFTKDRKSLDEAIASVKKLPINWNLIEVHETTAFAMGITESLKNMGQMISGIKIGAIALAVILLSVISYIWQSDRLKEIGTFLSLGIKKRNITFQFNTEVLLIACLALSLSYFSGKAISQGLGEHMSTVAAENASREIRKGFTSQLGADIASANLTKTPDTLEVEHSVKDIFPAATYTLAIILGTQVITLSPVFRKKARELLMD